MQLSEFSHIAVFFFSAAFSKESMPITAPLNFPTLYFASNLRVIERLTSTDWELSEPWNFMFTCRALNYPFTRLFLLFLPPILLLFRSEIVIVRFFIRHRHLHWGEQADETAFEHNSGDQIVQWEELISAFHVQFPVTSQSILWLSFIVQRALHLKSSPRGEPAWLTFIFPRLYRLVPQLDLT